MRRSQAKAALAPKNTSTAPDREHLAPHRRPGFRYTPTRDWHRPIRGGQSDDHDSENSGESLNSRVDEQRSLAVPKGFVGKRRPGGAVPPWLTALAAAGAFAAVLIAESRWPLRLRRESRTRRFGRNLAMAGLTAAVTSAVQAPLLHPLATRVELRRLGLLHRFALPRPVRTVLGVLLLDYTLWWWHWINHRIPFFWRFHLVHHVDRDLDGSTGLRFHFGEIALSVLYRMAQVRVLGVDRLATSLWQFLLVMSVFFHHSNTNLPNDVDRALTRFIVTPRMHGIHHSDYFGESNSNWASLFTWWDFLHGTFRQDVAQPKIEIGVPAYQEPRDVTLGRIAILPFREQRADWVDWTGVARIERPTLSPGGARS